MDKLRAKFIQRTAAKGIRPGSREYTVEMQDYDYQKRQFEKEKQNGKTRN